MIFDRLKWNPSKWKQKILIMFIFSASSIFIFSISIWLSPSWTGTNERTNNSTITDFIWFTRRLWSLGIHEPIKPYNLYMVVRSRHVYPYFSWKISKSCSRKTTTRYGKITCKRKTRADDQTWRLEVRYIFDCNLSYEPYDMRHKTQNIVCYILYITREVTLLSTFNTK